MNDKPDPAAFSVDERPGQYKARFSVYGSIEVTIEADSLEDAKAKAEAMTEDENFGLALDSADDVGVSYVQKEPKRYLIFREGKAMQTTGLKPGDLPREPNERGF